MEAFLNGVVAGYGIAIPVGAIAVLIVEVGMRCGFRCGAFAGAGAASADLLYATAAVVGGAALAATVESVETPLKYASGVVLAAIAIAGLLRARRDRRQPAPVTVLPDRSELRATYARFLGLTIINPLTIAYFAAFVVGLGLADGLSLAGGVVFVAGAFLASLSWQLLLAGVGALAGLALSDRVRVGTIVFGNLLVLGLALVVVLR
jgi:threonine/homoserine/homoserine lactone efflux protein